MSEGQTPEEAAPGPVTVSGSWSPVPVPVVRTKLQLYFQSRKKSGGGECRVEAAGGDSAAVYFTSEDARERVLARENHEIILENQTIRLRVTSDLRSREDAADPAPGAGAAEQKPDELRVGTCARVLLENVGKEKHVEMLSLLVENISALKENSYSLEIIQERSCAVISFSSPADADAFLAVGQSSQKLQKYGLTARPLEAAKSVRVEALPPAVVRDMLELHFEKNWVLPDNIVMIPHEEAALVTFRDTRVVEDLCRDPDHMIRSTPVKVYPYHESLGVALYGRERPAWKVPEPFTERVHPVIWKFLLKKKHTQSISEQMARFSCAVDLDHPEVKLRPLPGFFRQKGLTEEQVNKWMRSTRDAFCKIMSQYVAFECTVTPPAWASAETAVRSVVQDNALLEMDASKQTLTVAGRADLIRQIRAPVEDVVLKAMNQIKRQENTISEDVPLAPAMFYILKQEGLNKAAQDVSPEMILSYSDAAQKLTITGVSAEVYKMKSWILEINMKMSKKLLDVSPGLLDFLKSVDTMDMSLDLFTSHGISATYSIERKGVLLLGSSDSVLLDADKKMKMFFSEETLDVEDREVLKLQSWVTLKQQLLDTYNSSKKKTVAIQVHQEMDKISVAGFMNPVKEISCSLQEFITNNSRVQESLRMKSSAVVQFIDKKLRGEWSKIAKTLHVWLHFDEEKSRTMISGTRLNVQKAKVSLQELSGALVTDSLTVDKPGAKKYFQSQGRMVLSTIMSELSCVVLLRSDSQEEEEEENLEEENSLCYCTVKTSNGVVISVRKADICSFSADAVVNAANEDLQHIGGLALALLKAAGPELQKISDDYIAKNGKLKPGGAITTGACRLPCKYVVHTVGPRFHDYDRKAAVWHLKLAVTESLKQAVKVGCSTVALPAVSSGVFGFPVDLCADTIAEAVREFCYSPGSLTEIHLVDNNGDTAWVLASAVNREFSELKPVMTAAPQAGRTNAASGRYHRGRSRGRGFGDRGGRGGGGRGKGRGGGGQEGGRGGYGASWAEAGWGGGGQQGSRRAPSPRGHSWPRGHGGPGRAEQVTPEGLKVHLRTGNIEDQTTSVIVNSVSEDLDLDQGAVSRAILRAAGPGLQAAVQLQAAAATTTQRRRLVTDAFSLRCLKVFHVVCPAWDNGAGQAEEELASIIRWCLEEAERQQMSSLSFPAVGTGNLSFPQSVVSRLLQTEILAFSRGRPRHLREAAVVVHPSDSQTAECFSREFKGHAPAGTRQREDTTEARSQSRESTASFSQVSSPSLGVYQMQMGQLSLEVSSGDITKEACDVIVNSSNQNFTLRSGVSRAILDGAGPAVEQECAQIVTSAGSQLPLMILTTAGSLPSKNILHIAGQKDPTLIKDIVSSVLKTCEKRGFSSVSFPALGTGHGGADPAAVADAMVGAVVEFVRKKQVKSVRSVKILIFQTAMTAAFHASMRQREGQQVEEKGFLSKVKDTITSVFAGFGEERRSDEDVLVLEVEEFEPIVFQLCADNKKTVMQAKQRITEMIVAEQTRRTISDPIISSLSAADMEQLRQLQRELSVSIRLEGAPQGPESSTHLGGPLQDHEPRILLEGLTRDVLSAESTLRDLIRRAEKKETRRREALLVSGMVEWQFQSSDGTMQAFDIYTNRDLEEALRSKQSITVKINQEAYQADTGLRMAMSARGHKVELLRKEIKDEPALPPHWDDMKGQLVALSPVTSGSSEYGEVEAELQKNGLTLNIISVERVQNPTLWCSYQLMKQQLEKKNPNINNERRLFHGTGANAIDRINAQGFNRSYAGTHAAVYGNGAYFAVDPAYSAQGYAQPDSSGHKRMYLARVLVGEFTKGRQGMIAPPSRSGGNAADLYDSVVDRIPNPSMFIVFSDMQAYPEYLITFT